MSNTQNILFMFGKGLVPEPIIDRAMGMVPAGFNLAIHEVSADADERRRLIAAAGYVLLYGARFDDLDVAAEVKLLQLLSAGYDRLDLTGLAAAGIPAADNGGANANTVAEHALLLMLAVSKRLPLHHTATARGDWLGMQHGLQMRELAGKAVGIVGFGRIGQLVAKLVSAFNARVLYYDVRDVELTDGLQAQRCSLDELLEQADIISLHTPLVEASRNLIGATELARMRDGAVLINTSRGGVIDEDALVEALAAGRLGGAGLDVFATEPLPARSPLVDFDNVVLTPHIAGTTIDTWTRRLEFAFANVQRVAAGQGPESVIPTPPG